MNTNESRYKKYIDPKLWSYIKENRMAMVAIKGAISELESYTFIKSQLGEDWRLTHNNDGEADFTATNIHTNQKFQIEAKRCGTEIIDFQRAIREKIEVRLYDYDFCDILCVDHSDFTGKLNDYKFIHTNDLPNHKEYADKIKPRVKISDFSSTLTEVMKKNKKII
tara:strand:- start:1526 stop:2023 length:498 start_codon:yes stop_codon:yes gene_type:complete